MKHTNRLLNHRNNLATLMQSLFYPATLGAGVVWTLEQFGQRGALKQFPKNIAIYFSILLVIYFSRSFLMINDAIKRQSYNLPAFVLDFFQVALIVFAFFLLRMPDMCNSDNRCLSLLYFVFTPIPIIDALWNLAAVRERQILWLPTIICLVALLVGAFWGWQYTLFNWILFLFLLFLLVYYFWLVGRSAR